MLRINTNNEAFELIRCNILVQAFITFVKLNHINMLNQHLL